MKTFVDELANGYRQIQLHGLLRIVAQLYSGEQTLDSIDMARRWLLPRMGHSTADIYRELCRKVTPLRIVDKSPIYGLKPETLHRIPRRLSGCSLPSLASSSPDAGGSLS